jgi:hypothetical protein
MLPDFPTMIFYSFDRESFNQSRINKLLFVAANSLAQSNDDEKLILWTTTVETTKCVCDELFVIVCQLLVRFCNKWFVLLVNVFFNQHSNF